jgi:tetratricopeptide (TPR) repeat protein
MLATTMPVLFALGLLPGLTVAQRPVGDQRVAMLHYRSGWEHYAIEAWADAAREFQAAIDVDPEFKLAYYGLGRANMAQKKFVEAVRAYEKCRDIHIAQASRNFSNKSDADRIISDDLMQYDMAISRLQSGPQTVQTQAQIAQWQNAKQRLQNRMRGTDSMSISSQVPPFVSLALGSAYFRTGRLPEAEKEYKTAIEADAKLGEAHSNLAALYLETGRIDDAEKAVKAAEKTGFKVNPMLKEDIAAAKKKS